MKIQEFSHQEKDTQSVRATIQKVWDKYCLNNHWPIGKTRVTNQAVHASIRGQEKIEDELGPDERWSLEINIDKIAGDWNWKKTPAPIQLLQSDKLWKGILNNLLVDRQESSSEIDETYEALIRWTEAQIKTKSATWLTNPNRKKYPIREGIAREIQELAHALQKLNDLPPPQIIRWKEDLAKMLENF